MLWNFKRMATRTAAASLSIAVALGSLSLPAHAGLKEALNEMFIGTSTNPQAISTQRLKGMYGGSMTLRPISSGINVIQFAPPKIDAGCGGVDIFFGSFSFINGAQFEQLIRSIAANAVGFAIKAAIESMCSPCAKLIAELEAAMRELNAMAKNTCAIGKALLTSEGRGKLMEQASNIGKRVSTALGNFADELKAENSRNYTNPNETAKGTGPGTSGTGAEVAANNPLDGNLVYLAARESLDNGGNTLRLFLSRNDAIGIVMGLYGVVIINPETNTPSNCSGTTPPERCVKEPETFEPTITRWDNLMYPARFDPDGVMVRSCGGSDCRSVPPARLPLATWGGVTEIINRALFGTSDIPTSKADVSPDSVVGMFVHKSGEGALSASARSLISVAPLPIINLMMETQDIEGASMTLGIQLAEVLPQYLAYKMAVEFQGIGANVFSGQTKKDMPALYERNLKEKARQLDTLKPVDGTMAKILNETTKSMVNIRNLTRSQLSVAPKR